MPRGPRLIIPGAPHHLVQRGNNRQPCFSSDSDMAAYIHWLRAASCAHKVAIHAWVLMTNHVHLLATPESESSLSRMMQSLGRQYVCYFNRVRQRTGTLWEGRFRSSPVLHAKYFMLCQRYIELNPVRACLVADPGDYHWSSYQSNALGVRSSLLQSHPIYKALGNTDLERQASYRALFARGLSRKLIHNIRDSLNKGLVL